MRSHRLYLFCFLVVIFGCDSPRTAPGDNTNSASYGPSDINNTAFATASSASASADVLQDDLDAIVSLADQFKSAYVSKDYATVADLMYPELVNALGGRDKLLTILRSEEAKNKDAGMKIHSLDISKPDQLHRGSKFRIAFLPTVLEATSDGISMRSESFQIAFARLNSDKWYLIDGTQMTPLQFSSMFPGLPESLQMPHVKKTVK